MAGSSARPAVDQLEARQLLFTLTIGAGDINPFTGLGQVRGVFEYLIPQLQSPTIFNPIDPNVVDEDFNDEFPPAGGGQPPLVQNFPSGRVLLASNVRIQHNILPGANFQVRGETDNTGNPTGERYMRAAVELNQFFSFQPLSAAVNGVRIAIRQMSFDITGDGTAGGLDASKFTVQLFFRGTLIESNTGAALLAKSNTGASIGRFTFNAPATNAAFDELRIVATGSGADAFRLDNLQYIQPAGEYATFITERLFGAELILAGRLGTTVQVFDLYGRDMPLRGGLGIEPGSTVPNIDLDDNGVPEGHDGIGRIVISNSDDSTAISMWGGRWTYNQQGDPEDDASFGNWRYRRVESMLGLYDDFEGGGFGFALDTTQTPPVVVGLPPGSGSVIIGSPWVRNNTSNATYNPTGLPNFATSLANGFLTPTQGIFVQGKANIAGISLHGMIFGSSNFTGSVERLNIGTLYGSVTVAGDLGSLIVATDAGLWQVEAGINNFASPTVLPSPSTDGLAKTGGQLIVGRTLGEVTVGARSLLDITVIGDTTDPAARPPRDILTYYEKEFVFGFDPAQGELEDTIRANLFNTDFAGSRTFRASRTFDQGQFLGDGFLRNDTFNGAEWVSTLNSGVRIFGDISGKDHVTTGDDQADVFAFAADGLNAISVEMQGAAYFRIMDENGRTVAAPNFTRSVGASTTLRYTPSTPGVYYVVVGDPAGNDPDNGTLPYSLTVLGMAPVTLGSYRTGGSSGSGETGDRVYNNTVNVLAGNVGSLRIGTGYVNGGGGETSTQAFSNSRAANEDLYMHWLGGTVNVPANLFSIWAGSDIEGGATAPVVVNVGGDFGSLITARSRVTGQGPSEGDVNNFQLLVGGRVASIDIKGASGVNQDSEIDPLSTFGDPPGNVKISTGRKGGSGDIGVIRYGSHIANDALMIETSPNSTVGAFLVSQDIELSDLRRQGLYFGNDGIVNRLGAGSDVRFVDFPLIDQRGSVDTAFDIITGQTLTLVDDGGGQVRIRVVGAVPAGNIVGLVRVLPINASLGVAIGQIVVDLTAGLSLEIDGVGTPGSGDVISIGKIIVSGADPALSGITIKGNVQTDVWRITSAATLNFIRNETPLGDIVAIDTAGLTTLNILTGDLGRTQVPSWGPRTIGPFLGIGAQAGDRETSIPLAQLVNASLIIDDDWNGQLYRPVDNVTWESGNAYLDDVGAPFDPYLNGLIARTGTIDTVNVGGAIGDVLAPTGNIVRISANFDRVTPKGRFDGIVGTLFGVNIFRVDIGDGLARSDGGPLTTTGIFALNDIVQVLSENSKVANISSVISAANSVRRDSPNFRDGIDTLDLRGGGDYVDAFISASNLDEFWTGFIYGDDRVQSGDIFLINGVDADIFRSEITADSIVSITLANGFYDASFLNVTRNLGTVTTAGYRNTTLAGSDLEFMPNVIQAAGDVTTLTTAGKNGDMSDLIVNINGSVLQEISARTFNRVEIDVDNQIRLLDAKLDFRSSKLTAGEAPSIKVGRSVQSSKLTVAGPISDLAVTDGIVNTDIASTGPNGRIAKITATNLISGSVFSTGPIDTIESKAGDVRLKVTTTGANSNVKLLKAARDLVLSTDIAGTVDTLDAGRHIGSKGEPSAIVIRGDLQNATAKTGQLYSDLRVGGSIVGGVSTFIVSSTPGNNLVGTGSIIAFGRINKVNVLGDFAGDIISYSGGIGEVTILGGSFHPGRTIAAYDGSIGLVQITAGNLYGDIHADQILFKVEVNADGFGVFGDIGINAGYSSQQAYDIFRNRLPVGVAGSTAIQGPHITAGWNIGQILVTNGSIFETTIHAGWAVGSIDVRKGDDIDPGTGVRSNADNGNMTVDPFTYTVGNTISAGDSIFGINVQGNMIFTFILGGLLDLGADRLPGGVGANADTNKSGRVTGVNVDGNSFGVVMSVGMRTGPDGLYNTGDDLVTLGVSSIDNLRFAGTAQAMSAFSDILTPAILGDSRIFAFGPALEIEDPQIDPVINPPGTLIGASGLSFTRGAESATITFSGPGQAYYDATGNRVVLVNTGFSSNLNVNVTSGSGLLTDFDIVSNDDASVNRITISGGLAGDSDIVFDAYIANLTMASYRGTGSIKVGQDIGSLIIGGSFSGGFVKANYVNEFVVRGDYGNTNGAVRDEVFINLLAGGGISITGANRGAINVSRDLGGLFVGGAMQNATLRAGGSVGGVDTGTLSRSWISARDSIGNVKVRGDMFDSSILGGTDLGTDTEFGGFGFAADKVTTGSVGDVTVSGNFAESDIVAGMTRGADGFFGTADDLVAEGRSTIGKVTISGTEVGSTRESETYRISATGSIGAVTIGGVPGQRTGNFDIVTRTLPPLPLQVKELTVKQESLVYTARIVFNQAVDSSSLGNSIGVYEVRGAAQTEIRLVNGVDYSLTYDPATFTVSVRFNPDLTRRDLPELTGVPGPGLYRFKIDQASLRGQLVNTKLDGDGNGLTIPNDHYSADDLVGDVGDKFVNQRTDVRDNNNTVVKTVDFRAAADLNVLLDDNRTPDGLPDPNRTFTIRGTIGDHPDNDTNFFRFGSDEDLFKITLQAGQIFRIGEVGGDARAVPVWLVDSNGQIIPPGTASDHFATLPTTSPELLDVSAEQAFLVRQTGTYYLLVGATTEFGDPNVVPNEEVESGQIGDYQFTVQVFDDGDTGFAATTDAGNGTNVVNAPAPAVFAGSDGVFGTGDDLFSVSIGGFIFTHSRGADGAPNTADDLVSGTDASGTIVSTRTGTGVQTSVVSSAIGPKGHAGIPTDVFADADVYHLNNRLPIATGSKVRITVKLTELGADLGSRNQRALIDNTTNGNQLLEVIDYRGAVQFAVFDTTDAVGTDDARLVFSPTDFLPTGSKPGTLVAGQNATYGYDANGDYFIEFIAPGRQSNPSQAATYAVYLQGAFNTDYRIEVVTNANDAGQNQIVKRKQNVFIETRGGTVNWLQAGGLTSTLSAFRADILGFTGTRPNGQTFQDYIVQGVASTLQSVFDAAGLDVSFSTDPRQFEFEEFSTVYLTSSVDPLSLLFDSLSIFGLQTAQPFGFSERSDPFNSDSSDEAVIFAPSFAALSFTPSQGDVDRLVQSLSASIGRRVGELLGLRITSNNLPTVGTPRFDIMAADSVFNPPGASDYEVSSLTRSLSTTTDTIERSDFFLGRQNASSLLDQYLSSR